MNIFPVILDSRPAYLESADPSLSILQVPFGGTSVGSRLAERLKAETRRKPVVVRTFAAGPGYNEVLHQTGVEFSVSLDLDEFAATVNGYEPSDWLLLVDAQYVMFPLDLVPLLGGLDDAPRIARHLVVLDRHLGGTNERVEFDQQGRVRRIRRYYDAVTWTVTAAVPCSLVPVSSLTLQHQPRFASLIDLRRQLAAGAVPSRDLPLSSPVFDLTTERDLLRLNEHWLARPESAENRNVARQRVGVRVVGSVVIHDEATIEDNVTIIGPSIVGRGTRIGRDSVVAQCVVAPRSTVPAASVVRHRVVGGTWSDTQTESLADAWIEQSEPTADSVDDNEPARRVYPVVKTIVEALIASVALIAISPLLLIIAILIKLESRGPVFFGDPREARSGRLFRCYKFRTMVVGADVAQRDLMGANKVDGPQFKMDHDPRVTRLGRFLRVSCLDELPQLFNVALGQMSLVGPRPSPFRENQTCVPWRDARLSVRPGITGLWQVCRHDRAAGDFHQWIYYDMQYVRHMSFYLDLKIVAATVLVLGGRGYVPLSWMIPTASGRHS